jgi:hypothetical protein
MAELLSLTTRDSGGCRAWLNFLGRQRPARRCRATRFRRAPRAGGIRREWLAPRRHVQPDRHPSWPVQPARSPPQNALPAPLRRGRRSACWCRAAGSLSGCGGKCGLAAVNGTVSHGLSRGGAQHTNASRPVAASAKRILANALSGSSKNITPNRERARSNTPGSKACNAAPEAARSQDRSWHRRSAWLPACAPSTA